MSDGLWRGGGLDEFAVVNSVFGGVRRFCFRVRGFVGEEGR